MLAQTQTFNGPETPGIRLADVNNEGFLIRFNEVNVNANVRSDGLHTTETVGLAGHHGLTARPAASGARGYRGLRRPGAELIFIRETCSRTCPVFREQSLAVEPPTLREVTRVKRLEVQPLDGALRHRGGWVAG